MYYTIYQTTNLVNGKTYIGMHSTHNLNDGYIGSGKLLWKAVEKYGKTNFKTEILHFLNTFQEMVDKEKEIVNESYLRNGNTYNLCQGGRGGPIRAGATLTQETKDKISIGTKLAMQDDLLRERLSTKRKGRATKDSTRQLMSTNRSGRIWLTSPEADTCKHVKLEESALLLSEGWIEGRIMNNAMKNPETAKQNGAVRKRSLMLDGITYGGYKEAALALGKSHSYIQSLVKNGKAFFGEKGSGF